MRGAGFTPHTPRVAPLDLFWHPSHKKLLLHTLEQVKLGDRVRSVLLSYAALFRP